MGTRDEGVLILSKDKDVLFPMFGKWKSIILIFQEDDTLLVDLSGDGLMLMVCYDAIGLIGVFVIKNSHGHH